MSSHVKGIQDILEFWIPRLRFRIPITGFKIFFSETWIPDSNCSRIPDSYSCIPDSKTQEFGFHQQKCPRFRISQAKISRIPESGFPHMGRIIYLKLVKTILAKSFFERESFWKRTQNERKFKLFRFFRK